MGKFAADAEQLLKLVGGKENINAVTHCVTRMRFVLADPSKADVKAQRQGQLYPGGAVPGHHRQRGGRVLRRVHQGLRH